MRIATPLLGIDAPPLMQEVFAMELWSSASRFVGGQADRLHVVHYDIAAIDSVWYAQAVCLQAGRAFMVRVELGGAA